MTASSNRIAIVGAGPGGLILARILHLHSLSPVVFERDAHTAARPQGWSLDMHPESGQWAIAQAGLTAEFQQLARYDDQESRIYDKHANLLFEDRSNTGDRPEIDRAHLRNMLLASIPAHLIRWDHHLLEAVPNPDTTVTLHFRNAPTQTFDLVVGADGAWSRVRPLLSSATPVYSGILFFELSLDNVDRQHPELARLIGHGLTFALGDERALIAHRDSNAHIGAYAGLPLPADWPTGNLDPANPVATRTTIASLFPGWSPALLDLIHRCGDTIIPRGISTLPIGHQWTHRPGLTLLGDAAHLMSPFSGEGANLAMQDAADLALALLAAPSLSAAVQQFESQMFPRAEAAAIGAHQGLTEAFSPDGLQHTLDFMRSLQPPHV